MESERNTISPARRILRAAGILLLTVVLAAVWLLGWLTLAEYRPAERGPADVIGESSDVLRPGDTLRLVTWNIGYGGLGDDADFFMDGGTRVRAADREQVEENLQAMLTELGALAPDVIFLQEVDVESDRSYNINEAAFLTQGLPGYQYSFAFNYRVLFVPYPLPPLGGINSGLLTLCVFPASSAERVQLPCPFSWPVRTANLKRCMLVTRIPLEGSDRELVLVNLHLEAYDSGEGKLAQTHALRTLLEEEAFAGNYVIAGGDFNQIFSSVTNPFPILETDADIWLPGEIDVSLFSRGWQFAMDTSLPSCRSLDRPLAGADPADFQYYLIDGFIVSAGLEIRCLQTQDLGFESTDHNPVLLRVRLPEE